MKNNSTPRPRGQELLTQLPVDVILAFGLIELLADETFTNQFVQAHNIECVSPDYQRQNN